jgi:triosephosphate isomerase
MHPMIAGNWKMNGLLAQLAEIETIAAVCESTPPRADCLICPPMTLLALAARLAKGRIAIGAQSCHTGTSGAFTGDISAGMCRDAGASAVILGHSERRQHHGETNQLVETKVLAAWDAGLLSIVCIGETERQRAAGRTRSTLEDQMDESLPDGLTADRMIVAHEPLWAIGSGLMPEPEEIEAVHARIRQALIARFGDQGRVTRILYGGSVKPDNARDILSLANVDGALVGGASLCAVEFEAILRSV